MINYVQHLNEILMKFDQDSRLNTNHISLYIALFHHWNLARFRTPFMVSRDDILTMSKIRSKTTYYKCLKDLDKWQYLSYNGSKSKYVKSVFDLSILVPNMANNELFTEPFNGHDLDYTEPLNGHDVVPTEPANGHDTPFTEPLNGHDVVPYLKQKKHIKETVNFFLKKEESIIEFFISQGATEMDAQQFWNYYESRAWKLPGNIQIENWKAAAKSWILKGKQIAIEKAQNNSSNLSTSKSKNYNEPL